MRYKHILEHRETLKNAIDNIFYQSINSQLSLNEILELRKTRIYEYKYYKKIPHYIHEYLNGYFDCNFNQLYKHHLEFCYILNDKIISMYKKSERYYEKLGYKISDFSIKGIENHHYWINTDKYL